MKYTFFLLLLICQNFCFSQDTLTKTDVQNRLINENGKIRVVPFSKVQSVPVYKGCDEKLSNTKLKKCMSDKISSHVLKYFNKNLAKPLNLPSQKKVRINVLFKIDETGKVGTILVKAPHPRLEKEARRVVLKIPDMTRPGMQDGEAVVVPYSLPIIFSVENRTKSSKKENQ